MNNASSRVGGYVTITVAALMAAACATSPVATESAAAPKSSADAASASASSRVVDLYAEFAVEDRLYPGPRALAGASQLVVTGTVESAVEGRTFGLVDDPDVNPWSTVLMRVRVAKVVGGEFNRDVVLVELPLPLRQPASSLDTAARGEDVVLYLGRVLPESPGDSDYVMSFGPAWPEDDVVYEPANTQGFIIEDDGYIDTPLGDSDSFGPEVEMADLLPQNARWPERSKSDRP